MQKSSSMAAVGCHDESGDEDEFLSAVLPGAFYSSDEGEDLDDGGYRFEPWNQDWEGEREDMPGVAQSDIESDSDSEDADDAAAQRMARTGNTNWCTCDKCECTTLEKAEEHVCCLEKRRVRPIIRAHELECITDHEDFEAVCLRQAVLRNLLVMLNDLRCDGWDIDPPENDALRWAAYRAFTMWIYGRKLGRLQRRVVPACVVTAIRKQFPNAPGVPYKPFEEKENDSEDEDSSQL